MLFYTRDPLPDCLNLRSASRFGTLQYIRIKLFYNNLEMQILIFIFNRNVGNPQKNANYSNFQEIDLAVKFCLRFQKPNLSQKQNSKDVCSNR